MAMQLLYGPGFAPEPEPFYVPILRFLASPFLVIISFVVGSLLFLLTKKKIFIVLPLIIFLLYFISKLILDVFFIF